MTAKKTLLAIFTALGVGTIAGIPVGRLVASLPESEAHVWLKDNALITAKKYAAELAGAIGAKNDKKINELTKKKEQNWKNFKKRFETAWLNQRAKNPRRRAAGGAAAGLSVWVAGRNVRKWRARTKARKPR